MCQDKKAVNRLLQVVVPALARERWVEPSAKGEVRDAWCQLINRLFGLRVWRQTVELPAILRHFRDTTATLDLESPDDKWMYQAVCSMRNDVEVVARDQEGDVRSPDKNFTQVACKQIVAGLGHHKSSAYHTCLRLARSTPAFFARTFLAQLDSVLRERAFGIRARVFMNKNYHRLFLRAILVMDQLGAELFRATEWPSLMCTMVSVLHIFADHCVNSYSAVPPTIRAFACKLADMMWSFATCNVEHAKHLLLRSSVKAVLLMWSGPQAGVDSTAEPPPHPSDTKELRAEAQALYAKLQSLLRMLEEEENTLRDANKGAVSLANTQVSFASETAPAPLGLNQDDLLTTRRMLESQDNQVILNCLENLRVLTQYHAGIAQLHSEQLMALASRANNEAFVPALLRLCAAAASSATQSYLTDPAPLQLFCCQLFERVVGNHQPQHRPLALQTAKEMFACVSADNKIQIATWLFRLGNDRAKGKPGEQSGADVLIDVLK